MSRGNGLSCCCSSPSRKGPNFETSRRAAEMDDQPADDNDDQKSAPLEFSQQLPEEGVPPPAQQHAAPSRVGWASDVKSVGLEDGHLSTNKGHPLRDSSSRFKSPLPSPRLPPANPHNRRRRTQHALDFCFSYVMGSSRNGRRIPVRVIDLQARLEGHSVFCSKKKGIVALAQDSWQLQPGNRPFGHRINDVAQPVVGFLSIAYLQAQPYISSWGVPYNVDEEDLAALCNVLQLYVGLSPPQNVAAAAAFFECCRELHCELRGLTEVRRNLNHCTFADEHYLTSGLCVLYVSVAHIYAPVAQEKNRRSRAQQHGWECARRL